MTPHNPIEDNYTTPYGVVYKATAPSGKMYIGQTTMAMKYRIRKHRYGNHIFARAVRKYGAAIVWEVVAECHSQLSLDAAEIRAIAQAREAGIPLYNVKGGGRGGKHAPETIAKISARLKGRASHRKGVPHTPETRAQMRAKKLGIKLTPEHCAKISAARRGVPMPPRTAEHCAKISAGKKGKAWTPTQHAACIRRRQRKNGMLI